MSTQDTFGFLIFALVAAITPGPSNVMLTATGATVGLWRSLPCLFGVSLGMGSLMLFVALGLGKLSMHQHLALQTMNWVGVVIMIWLSWKIASTSHFLSAKGQSPVGFIGAALFQWINPKSWIVGTSAVSVYFRPHSDEVMLHAFIFALLFMIVALPCNLIWLSLGAMLERLLTNPVAARSFNVVMGILLMISTIPLLLRSA